MSETDDGITGDVDALTKRLSLTEEETMASKIAGVTIIDEAPQRDGGPAFPLPPMAAIHGVSLRQWYAGQALAGLVQCSSWEYANAAKIAFAYADAMIAEGGEGTISEAGADRGDGPCRR